MGKIIITKTTMNKIISAIAAATLASSVSAADLPTPPAPPKNHEMNLTSAELAIMSQDLNLIARDEIRREAHIWMNKDETLTITIPTDITYNNHKFDSWRI